MIEAKAKQSAVFNCYLGVVAVSMAKYTINPFSKLNYFQSKFEDIQQVQWAEIAAALPGSADQAFDRGHQ